MSSVNEKKPLYWRTLAERAGDADFDALSKREFATELEGNEEKNPNGRRRFLQVMGASLAAATAGCEKATDGVRWKKDYVIPHVKRPPNVIPGVSKEYSTAMDLSGSALGLRITSFDGRPIKVEGNPAHPDSQGAATVYAQAAIGEMYDPDRSQGARTYEGGAKDSDWAAFEKVGRQLFDDKKAAAGQGLVFLAEASSSPTLEDLRRRLKTSFQQARWVEWEAASRDNERAGASLAFGEPVRTVLALDKARVVLSLDSDFVIDHPAAIGNARALMRGRNPETRFMHRLYAVESRFTSTGGVADHRLPLPSSYIKAFAAALDAELSAKSNGEAPGAAQPKPGAPFLADEKVKKFFDAVVEELIAVPGKSAVVVGANQPPEVHALVHRINALLGNVGNAIQYVTDPNPTRNQTHAEAMKQLATELGSGQVDTIVVLGGNPVYDAPADVGFAEAYGKVKNRIHLSLYENETSRASTWHLPRAHWLESWGDARGWDGTLTVTQPIIAPLFDGRSDIELVAFVLNEEKQKGNDLVRRTHTGWAGPVGLDPQERAWKRALHEGVVPGTRFNPAEPELKGIAPLAIGEGEKGDLTPANGQLELVLVPGSTVYDGRFANNSWLQELPDMMTKLTWDNAALIGPKTAKALGVGDATWVELSMNGASLKVPALIAPGTAPGTVVLAYGYGRTEAGRVGGSKEQGVDPVGANAYALRSTTLFHFGRGLSVKATGQKAHISTTQDKHVIDAIGKAGTDERLHMLVREQDIADYNEKPDAVKHYVHHEPLLSLWQDPVSYDGHKWGMSIDLTKCIGCNACITACQAENNIPAVGKEKVARGKEMHWLRVDRYFKGDEDDPELAQQPVTCHQCEHAPCEQVCPVGATMHSSEGLNDMTYNRCIGTRYCSNNCPYKVRRFNFHNYHDDMKDDANRVKGMQFNPDVTVRFRGVMEKCTFCVQRIKKVTIQARNQRRPVADGEILTACQQTCPTQAIVFGDLNDPKAKVTEHKHRPRSYAMLQELNVRPRLEYLARIRNPNPKLAPPKPKDGHGGDHGSEGGHG